jgi:hypothetical protein
MPKPVRLGRRKRLHDLDSAGTVHLLCDHLHAGLWWRQCGYFPPRADLSESNAMGDAAGFRRSHRLCLHHARSRINHLSLYRLPRCRFFWCSCGNSGSFPDSVVALGFGGVPSPALHAASMVAGPWPWSSSSRDWPARDNAFTLGRYAFHGWVYVFISGAALILTLFTRVSPILILIAGIILGAVAGPLLVG